MGKKLTTLLAENEKTTLSNDDLVYVVDVSAASGSKSGGMTKANLAAQMSTSVAATQPIENEYANITALLADQAGQTEAFLQYVVDASDDPNIASGEAYYEKLSTDTATLADDYRLLSDTEVEVIRDSNSYRVFRIQAIQDDGTPLTSVNGGRISFEYSGTDVTAILFNKRYTDTIAEFYGADVNIRFYNRNTRKYQYEQIASTAWTTVNTDYYRGAVTGTNIQIADLTVNDRVEFFISESSGSGGGSTITESTGTTITFTQDTFYNNLTYLTSGNLTLDLTGAVVGTAAWVWCDKYIPTISGENFLLTGTPSTSKLNVYKMVYNGVQTDDYDIDVFVDTKTYLATPTITITPSDTVNTLSGFTVGNATSYEIISSTTNDVGTASAVSPAYDGTSSTYAHTGLTNGVIHYYWIKAINRSGYLDSVQGTASGASADQSFKFNVTASDSTFALPLLSNGTYNFDIYLDGVLGDTITTWNQSETSIALGDTLSHEIKLLGTIEGWSFSNNAQADKIYDIENWGTLRFSGSATTSRWFDGCHNLTVSATDEPDLTNSTSGFYIFKDCDVLTSVPGIADWDFSAFTTMNGAFRGCDLFNQDLDNLTTSSLCTSYLDMFYAAAAFNSDLTGLDLSAATTLSNMFRNASVFNGVINWSQTGLVTDVGNMFNNADAFNQDISAFDVGFTALGNFILLNNNAFSTANYDLFISSLEAQVAAAAGSLDNGSYRIDATYTETSVDSGTTDGTTANKLIESGQNFITTVTVGDIVHNTTDDTFAAVTVIDSDTQLALDNDIMVSGEAYVIQSSQVAKDRYALENDYGWTITDNGSV